MKKLLIGMVVALLIAGCGLSYDETKRLKQEKRTRELREDSAALKVAVMPPCSVVGWRWPSQTS